MKLTVFTEPVAKARPRVAQNGGKPRIYTPAKTQQAEWKIRTEWIAAHGIHPLAGAAALVVTAFLSMPASIPKRRRLTAMPTVRPDGDNYLKCVLDALVSVAFVDDKQVVDMTLSKRYAIDGPPRWEIEVTEALP